MQDTLNFIDSSLPEQLSGGFPRRMALLDCEATGSKPPFHRVTEIGIVFVDDGVITGTWSSLVNPERPLHASITKLTGITNEMLYSAPRYPDISDDLLLMLRNRVMVAHYAKFDYGFLKSEFERLGIHFQTNPLCSVLFSRKMFPHLKRHGLDQLIKRFSIPMADRHRGLDDALAIWHFFLNCSTLFEDQEIGQTCHSLLNWPTST